MLNSPRQLVQVLKAAPSGAWLGTSFEELVFPVSQDGTWAIAAAGAGTSAATGAVTVGF